MDNKRGGFAIPRQSRIYIALCLMGILIFVMGGILPEKKAMERLNRTITEKKNALAEQEALAPLFVAAKADAERKGTKVLPLPPPGKLPQDRINELPVALRTAAQMSGMTLVSATPNPGGMTGDLQFIPVEVVLRGGFMDFRKFLIQIGGISYLQHIEEITVKENADFREFRLKVWTAVG
ncbi:MAG: hypothetical protein QM278_06835 [Pseudomonadota bacterium]|nr:hypothetical protein [Pseudomonadota bacterium]